MKSASIARFIAIVVVSMRLLSTADAQMAITSLEKDVPGSKDSSLFSRIQGSYIAYYKKTLGSELKIPLDRVTFDYGKQKLNDFRTRTVHGTHQVFVYVLPRNVTTFQALQSSVRELRDHGVPEILFQGSKMLDQLDDGYDRFVNEVYRVDSDDPSSSFMRRGRDTQYLAVRLPRPDGEFFITVLATGSADTTENAMVPKRRVGLRVDIVESDAETALD